MLRKKCPARARASGIGGSSARGLALRKASLAALFASLAAGTGAADPLAQPKDDPLARTAAHYIRYREDIAAIEAMAFDNAGVTREAHRRLAAHDPQQLSAGWVAYAALVAADTPEFADTLKKEARKTGPGGSIELLTDLAKNPANAYQLKGADKAIASVLAMTAQDGARIMALGEAFKEQAYAMQKTNWGKRNIASAQERLAEAANFKKSRGAPETPALSPSNQSGAVAPLLTNADGQWSPDWGERAPAGKMSEANAQVIMVRVLNLAARYSMNSLNDKFVSAYARNDKSNQCLNFKKLILNQCIAATRTPYEEAFCLGEHALIDIADCVGWVGGAGAS